MEYPTKFDCIVVGGGHAGTEAALAAARLGVRTLLLTQSLETVGQMSCNPAIGGIGKGHLAREVDALGGAMARATDHAGIHFRTLNASKGHAVRATRAQADRLLYKQAIRYQLETQSGLFLLQQGVDDLLVRGNRVEGVVTQMGLRISARTVVLTVGTFLSGRIHVGEANYSGGRAGDPAALRLAEQLRALGLRVDRLKTGTPPRIDGSSIDYDRLEPQPGDEPTPVFSFIGKRAQHPRQVPCHITHTTERTHEIIRSGLSRSPLFSGAIEGVGPRYCPSIEDKVKRFSENPSHHIVIEPEWLGSDQVYINGFSTSLPEEIQIDSLKKIPAFNDIKLLRPGYAIEYDFFPPSQLKNTLESKDIPGLFFAGQVNGTSGYEEASAQGLDAGINASCFIEKSSPLILSRHSSYMGVLIDDLVTKDTLEPYRMFTSRAEYRIMLRYSNAEDRLFHLSKKHGLLRGPELKTVSNRLSLKNHIRKVLLKSVSPLDVEVRGVNLKQSTPAKTILKRPDISIYDLPLDLSHLESQFSLPSWGVAETLIDVDTEIKYDGYLKRHLREIERMSTNEGKRLLPDFDYKGVSGLSLEAQEKLSFVRPETLGQAMRVSGITPADISVLLIHVSK